jgi:hypothetical protein
MIPPSAQARGQRLGLVGHVEVQVPRGPLRSDVFQSAVEVSLRSAGVFAELSPTAEAATHCLMVKVAGITLVPRSVEMGAEWHLRDCTTGRTLVDKWLRSECTVSVWLGSDPAAAGPRHLECVVRENIAAALAALSPGDDGAVPLDAKGR